MDLTAFYSLMSVTCFTLVGLWWTVVERHAEWKTDPLRRRLAGGVYLSFLLPGLMSTFAQVDGGNALVWRTSFSVAAVVGLLTTLRLVSVERGGHLGPFRRFRWLVAVVYALILLLAAFPPVASVVGATPLQAASVTLILLVVMGHGLTWEFMMDPAGDAEGGSGRTAERGVG
jgi:cytochrome bd-type quinol oxidase subunit 2